MADGIRITQAGSISPRVTQGGQRRITERAVMMGAGMTAAPVMGTVQFQRRRSIGTTMQAGPSASVTLRGKTTLGAAMSTAGTASSSGWQARRGIGANLLVATQAWHGIGRTRTMCAGMGTAPDMDLQVTRQRTLDAALLTGGAVEFAVIKQARLGATLATDTHLAAGQDAPLLRQRSVSVDMSASATVTDLFLRKTVRVSTHLTSAPSVQFGRNETGSYRILEDGSPRVTQGANRRLIEESFGWGNIVVVYPPFKTFHHKGGLWYVLKPAAKHGNWQLPQGISVHWQGGWRNVVSNK